MRRRRAWSRWKMSSNQRAGLSWQKELDRFISEIKSEKANLEWYYTPIWEKGNLPGAQITVYAAEDIVLGNDRPVLFRR